MAYLFINFLRATLGLSKGKQSLPCPKSASLLWTFLYFPSARKRFGHSYKYSWISHFVSFWLGLWLESSKLITLAINYSHHCKTFQSIGLGCLAPHLPVHRAGVWNSCGILSLLQGSASTNPVVWTGDSSPELFSWDLICTPCICVIALLAFFFAQNPATGSFGLLGKKLLFFCLNASLLLGEC